MTKTINEWHSWKGQCTSSIYCPPVYRKHSGPVIWTKTCLDFGLQQLEHLKIFP